MSDFKSQIINIFNEITITKLLLSFIFIVLAPVKGALITAIVLGGIDFFLGIYASYKEGYAITSRTARRSISKICVYCLAIILCYHIQNNLLDYPLLTGITGLIALIEGKSIFENLYRITHIDFLKIIILKLQIIHDELNPTSSKDKETLFRGKRRDEK